MEIVITIISIAVLAGLARLLNLILPFSICPVCVGVSWTWIWILAGIYSGFLERGNWELVAAIAMGSSVAGIMYQAQSQMKSPLSLIWKTAFMVMGITAAYGLVTHSWIVGFPAAVFTLVLFFPIFKAHSRRVETKKAVRELEEKMKSCC